MKMQVARSMFSRKEKGTRVRYRRGDVLDVSSAELKALPDVFREVPAKAPKKQDDSSQKGLPFHPSGFTVGDNVIYNETDEESGEVTEYTGTIVRLNDKSARVSFEDGEETIEYSLLNKASE